MIELLIKLGGERGIRTLDTFSRIHAFQACAFNHSATSPKREWRSAGGFTRKHYPIHTLRLAIKNKEDLFNRGHKYKIVKLDEKFPKYILKNKKKLKKFIDE